MFLIDEQRVWKLTQATNERRVIWKEVDGGAVEARVGKTTITVNYAYASAIEVTISNSDISDRAEFAMGTEDWTQWDELLSGARDQIMKAKVRRMTRDFDTL